MTLRLMSLMPLVYEDPRHIARRQLKRGVCAQVVHSGRLAHETYLRLVQARGIQCQNCGHFQYHLVPRSVLIARM
jgi:hypothetical protein